MCPYRILTRRRHKYNKKGMYTLLLLLVIVIVCAIIYYKWRKKTLRMPPIESPITKIYLPKFSARIVRPKGEPRTFDCTISSSGDYKWKLTEEEIIERCAHHKQPVPYIIEAKHSLKRNDKLLKMNV